MLTIGYVTARKDNQVRWFFDSLDRELGGRYGDVQIVVVDFWAEAQRSGEQWTAAEASVRRGAYASRCKKPEVLRVVPPAPNVWQGPHRRTRDHFYAKSNALNTAVMHAKGDQLLLLDDLSVLSVGFFKSVHEALRHPQRITCFSFDKHDAMVVENGRIVSSRPKAPRPQDDRSYSGINPRVPAAWTYGGAILVPMEVILTVNGWPQDCDGMRSQDSAFGIVAGNAGVPIAYDPRAIAIESADRHAPPGGPVMRGCAEVVRNGRTRRDVFFEKCRSGLKRFSNYYGAGGLRQARAKVLAGAPVPTLLEPRTDWFTGATLERFEPSRPNNELART